MRLGDVVRAASRRLAAAGIESAPLDARVIVRHVCGLDDAAFLLEADRPVSAPEQLTIAALCERRSAREPVAHIVGVREFWSLPIRVTADTLVPRPDSETLVMAALDRISSDERGPILDLGTGSGALLLAILSERPHLSGVGIDVSERAARVARENAETLGFAGRACVCVGSWTGPLSGTFPFAVVNPPYIPSRDIETLAPDVRNFEPRAALDGGADGLDPLRRILDELRNGPVRIDTLIVELGATQDLAAGDLFAVHGWIVEELRHDLAGVARAIVARASVV